MANEFAHYEGAMGPEGKRRTTTKYGPVMGGMPIAAWHCMDCGTLRLSYPDGRKEERQLWPGPQPGLLKLPSAVAPEHVHYGRQYHVSGLSAKPQLYELLWHEETGANQIALRLPRVVLPKLDLLAWINVFGLISLALGLLLAAIMATAGYTLPSELGPLVITLAAIFGALLLLNALSPVWRHYFPMPELSLSVAHKERGAPEMDGLSRGAVTFFILAAIGLFVSAILSTYTYNAVPLTLPVLLTSLGAAVIGGVLLLWSLLRPPKH